MWVNIKLIFSIIIELISGKTKSIKKLLYCSFLGARKELPQKNCGTGARTCTEKELLKPHFVQGRKITPTPRRGQTDFSSNPSLRSVFNAILFRCTTIFKKEKLYKINK